MIIICFSCGKEKTDSFGTCQHCGSVPKEEAELELSALLTNSLLDEKTRRLASGSASYHDPRKISEEAYELIAGLLREDGVLLPA